MSSLNFKRLMFVLTSGLTLIQEEQAQILGDTQILLEPPSYLIRFSADFLLVTPLSAEETNQS